ncbi:hypothetical protein JHD49_11170 [Sulfurimonas sp. SAG-AH-194-C21]|nr:hypothetical protein [Sulfurimonas sp. SAG-AH-194-C21]
MLKIKLMGFSLLLIILSGCESSSSDSAQDSSSNVIGSGTVSDPYIVGNGVFSFTNSAYFNIDINTSNCNIIAYNINNLDPWGQTALFDNAFNSINKTGGNIYPSLSIGTYSLKANSDKSELSNKKPTRQAYLAER